MKDIEVRIRNDEELRERLGEEGFRIVRQKGTERAFTGRYWNSKTPGLYRCSVCSNPLFASDTKYDSGSGWPIGKHVAQMRLAMGTQHFRAQHAVTAVNFLFDMPRCHRLPVTGPAASGIILGD